MGYTHYYSVPAKLDSKKFAILSEELKVTYNLSPDESTSAGHCFPKRPIILAGGDGTGKPEFTKDKICFNGTEDGNMYHETFSLKADSSSKENRAEKGLVFNFCKTARKPYDFMVCVSLLRLKHHFPKSDISSDGDEEDWRPAIEFYKKVFGEDAPIIKY